MFYKENDLINNGVDVKSIKNKILKFQHKHPLNDKDIAAVQLTWTTKSGCKSLIVGPGSEQRKRLILIKANTKQIYLYARYDDELDVAEFNLVKIDTSRTAPVNRNWVREFHPIYIINKERAIYSNMTELIKYTGRDAKNRMRNFNCIWKKHMDYAQATEVAAKIIGKEMRLSSDTYIPTQYWCIEDWVDRKEYQPTNNKDLLFDDLPLWEPKEEEFSEYQVVNPYASNDNMVNYYNHPEELVKISHNEDYDIIRSAKRNIGECVRIFIDKDFNKNKIFIFVKETNGWQKISRVTRNWSSRAVICNPEEFQYTHRLKYITGLLYQRASDRFASCSAYYKNLSIKDNEYDKMSKVYIETNVLVSIIRHPIIEQLYKSGYKDIVLHIDLDFVKSQLQDIFDYDPKIKGNLYKQLGVNKFQLEYVNQIYAATKEAYHYYDWRTRGVIKRIKYIYGINDISSIDNETFVVCAQTVTKTDELVNMSTSPDNYARYSYQCRDYFALFEIRETDEKIRFSKKLAHFIKKYDLHPETFYSMFSDILRTKWSCICQSIPHVSTPFKDIDCYNDLVHIHDYLTETYNQYQAERRRLWNVAEAERYKKLKEKYQSIIKERKKLYEFSDNEYLLKIPEDPATELKNEGQVLAHCVGGYVNSQLSGQTNIIFLRKQSDPGTPFVTIEVRNDNVVSQIFGYRDAWIGSSEKYQLTIPFLMKWMHEKGLKTTRDRLTSKSMGYGRRESDGYVELPKVDFDVNTILL